MGWKLNQAAYSHALSLINSGKIDKTGSWSFIGEDGDKLLGDKGDDWANYKQHFLAIDPGADPKTKNAYGYPFSKGDTIARPAVIAIKVRTAQQKETDIYDAASKLLEAIDKKEKKSFLTVEAEKRFIDIDSEFRFLPDKNQIVGYAAKFNIRSGDLGGFTETIRPGCFRKTIQESDIRCAYNHSQDQILGRRSSGTLRLVEDSIGLHYECDLPNTTYAQDLKASIARGDVSQCSFSFRTIADAWSNGYTERELIEARLIDVGPVAYPAYQETEVKVRSQFAVAGINLQAVISIIDKSERKISLTEDDANLLRFAIDILNAYLPSAAPAVEDHADAGPDLSTRLRAKDIELKSNIILKNLREVLHA